MKQYIIARWQELGRFYNWFISGIWFVQIMRQVIITGGNIAESAFLLATLWVIVNAVAHALLTWYMPTHMIELVNYLSVIAFSALPELIIIPVIIICFSHWSVAIGRKDFAAGVWAVLYTIPAIFFLIMTIIAITTFVSTGGTHFVPADGIQLVIRCLSGWMYAVVNMLFKKLGEPHYASRFEDLETALAQKQEEIEQVKSHFENALRIANSNFQIAIQAKQSEFEDRLNLIMEQSKSEIERFQNLLESQNAQVQKLSERASSLTATGLENYPKVQIELVEKQVKTVSADVLSELTGISKRQIASARTLQRHNRNKDLILVASVIDWLKTAPLPANKAEQNTELPAVQPEQNTDPLPVAKPTNGHQKITRELGELVELNV